MSRVTFLPESAIRSRCLRTHEASHYVVAAALRLPTLAPRLLTRLGGDCRWDSEHIEAAVAGDTGPLDDVPVDLLQRAAINIASVFVAGYAGELIHSRDLIPTRAIIGLDTQDLWNARRVLALAGLDDDALVRAWVQAGRILRLAWEFVGDIAPLIAEVCPSAADAELFQAIRYN